MNKDLSSIMTDQPVKRV